MKVMLLMGRGIEGTGNTHWTIEMEEYYKSLNIYDKVFTLANNSKKWGRRQAQRNEIIEENFSKNDLSSYVQDNTLLIITSVPAKNDDEKTKENFTQFIVSMHKIETNKIVYLCVDHKIQSITRNYYVDNQYLEPFFKSIDIVCMHSFDNDFYQKFIVDYGIRDINRNCHYINFPMISVDVDELSIFKKNFKDKYDRTCHFIGRSPGWKGWQHLRFFQHNYLKRYNFSSCIEGIELSIGVLEDLYSDIDTRELRSDIYQYNGVIDNNYINHGKDASVYGPFIREEALDRVSKAKFAFFGTFIGKNYGGPCENTLLEDISVGTVTIIRKELYECGEFCDKDNKIRKLNEFTPKQLGLLIYDSNDPQTCLNQMLRLNDEEELYNEYVNNAINFVKTYFDRKHVQSKLYERIINYEKFEREPDTISLFDF